MSLPAPPVQREQDLLIPGPGGDLRARLWSPTPDANQPVLLYLHGGGYVVGGIETCEHMCRQIAVQSGAAVVGLEYRLAPEHKFPACLEDGFAALQWLAGHGATMGLDPQRLAVAGDSAGGGMAATIAIMARDAGIKLALQLMFYPTVQTSLRTPSLLSYGTGLLFSREMMRWFDKQYKDPGALDDWRRQPLWAASHAGLAPAWIGLAECDALADDGRLYAEALRKAGVPVEVREWPGVIHDFINMGRFIPEAMQAHSEAAHAQKRAFAPAD
jgi:acetyl esterase